MSCANLRALRDDLLDCGKCSAAILTTGADRAGTTWGGPGSHHHGGGKEKEEFRG